MCISNTLRVLINQHLPTGILDAILIFTEMKESRFGMLRCDLKTLERLRRRDKAEMKN